MSYCQPLLQHGGGKIIQIWGAIRHGKRYATPYEGALDSDRYMKIIDDFAKDIGFRLSRSTSRFTLIIIVINFV